MRCRRIILTIAWAATLTLATVVSSPAEADDPDCSEWNQVTAVGVPELDGGRGGVDLRYGSHSSVWRPNQGKAGDHLGAAVSELMDVDGDTCVDLAVGAPGADTFVRDSGVVWLLRGSPTGVADYFPYELPLVRSGDQFGFSLSLSRVVVPETEAENFILVVGAPGRDVGGVADAGAIAWTRVDSSYQMSREVTQGTAGVAGQPERGDRFGEVISSAFAEGLRGYDVMIGVPREDIGNTRDAGIVERLSLVRDLGAPGSAVYHQTEDGPMGSPEAGDNFGASIAIIKSALAVGVPGEDIGAVQDAGAVNLLSGTSVRTRPFSISYRPLRSVTQNSRRVSGNVEGGDRFGAIVRAVIYCEENANVRLPGGVPATYSSNLKLAIGAPGEDLGSVADAGTVTVYDSGLVLDPSSGRQPDPPCPSYLIRQDAFTEGDAEKGDRFGTDLGLRPQLDEEQPGDVLVIAVPGEDLGGVTDAGLLEVLDLGTAQQLPAETFSGGLRRGLHYATLH